jgi:hypothetical protein
MITWVSDLLGCSEFLKLLKTPGKFYDLKAQWDLAIMHILY